MMDNKNPTILIIEDGDEYLTNLTQFVPGPSYRQVKSGAAALTLLQQQSIDVIYLDMRFDRIPQADLLGDHVACTKEHNGDPVRAWKHLQNNQGLYILAALREAGFGEMPVILSYDFSLESRRFDHLRRLYPALHWVPDAVTPEQIRRLLDRIIR